MKLHRRVSIDRPPEDVFALVSDPERLAGFFVGITLWQVKSRLRRGKGARYRVLMRVGSIEAGGVLRLTEWREPELIEWESESGITQRGRWEVRPAAGGASELDLEIDFSLEGPGSWLVERLAGRAVARNMTASLLAARRLLEFERPAQTARTARPNRAARPTRAQRPAAAA